MTVDIAWLAVAIVALAVLALVWPIGTTISARRHTAATPAEPDEMAEPWGSDPAIAVEESLSSKLDTGPPARVEAATFIGEENSAPLRAKPPKGQIGIVGTRLD